MRPVGGSICLALGVLGLGCASELAEGKAAPGAACDADGGCASETCDAGRCALPVAGDAELETGGTASCPATMEGAARAGEPAGRGDAASGQCFVDLEAGVFWTSALRVDGTVWGWGSQVTNWGAVPGQWTNFGANVAEVALGYQHGCVRMGDRTLSCFGRNDFGQVGDGTVGPDVFLAPIAALGANVAEVAAATTHTCARKDDGTLWCWGANDFGEIGDGSTVSPRPSPVQVTALGTTVVQVDVRGQNTCARKDDGTVWCWGYNRGGEVGDGTTVSPRPSPVQVTALGTAAVEVATGVLSSCARKNDGTLWCWGANSAGELGDGSSSSRPSPVQVTALGACVVQVEVGGAHACARKDDGTLWCWGWNRFGQVGDGTTEDRHTPVQVSALGASIVEVAVGSSYTCARKNDGTLWCWGRNDTGQLGDLGHQDRRSPVRVALECP